MPTVDIVVLTWNQKKLIQDFVGSFMKHTNFPCRLIIIDQASQDGTPDYLRSLKGNDLCSIEPVFNTENKGYIGGVNQGMSLSKADYVCLANNDLLFTDGWLQEMVAVLGKNPKIGLLNPNSNNLGVFPKSGQSIDELNLELKQKYVGTFSEMTFCIGFCVLIRKEAVSQAGFLSTYFDNIFFDDTDYSMKVKKYGFLIGVAKGAYVWHMAHSSSKQMGARWQQLMDKNLKIFEEKWGKILRICWVITEKNELSKALVQGVSLARQGNYVTIYTTFSTDKAATLFKDQGMLAHSGVNVVHMNHMGSILWKNIIKKKKFHLVINKNRLANALLRMVGIPTLSSWNQEAYLKVKFS